MSIDPTPITREQVAKATATIAWNDALRKTTEGVIARNSDATQLELTRLLNTELHNMFNNHTGAFDVRVNPKGNDQIQIILTLDKAGDVPSVKIKQRYNVPSTLVEAA